MQEFSYRAWLRVAIARRGVLGAAGMLIKGALEIARDQLPARRRARYGDIDFDWDYRVDTTWANLSLGTRVRELFTERSYQPSDPLAFHEMMSRLPIRFSDFTFLDLGSGKGRALLMASDYPFRRIIGVELLPELHAVAQENVRQYRSARQKCRNFELHCGDARRFPLPPEPLVIFLFNPFPDDILREVVGGAERSRNEAPRKIFVAYQNPVSEGLMQDFPWLRRLGGTIQYAIFESK